MKTSKTLPAIIGLAAALILFNHPAAAQMSTPPANPAELETMYTKSIESRTEEILISGGLNGDTAATANYSIAQHNLGVLPVMHMKRFSYAFQACNGADQERQFVLTARQAPLSEIAAFLPSVPDGRTVIDRPGKVESLSIAASHKPNPADLEAATAVI